MKFNTLDFQDCTDSEKPHPEMKRLKLHLASLTMWKQSLYFADFNSQNFVRRLTIPDIQSTLQEIDDIYGRPESTGTSKTIHPKGGGDLFACLKLPLIIGACLGLIPVRGLMESQFHPKKQRFS
jgi:hypothetical protein